MTICKLLIQRRSLLSHLECSELQVHCLIRDLATSSCSAAGSPVHLTIPCYLKTRPLFLCPGPKVHSSVEVLWSECLTYFIYIPCVLHSSPHLLLYIVLYYCFSTLLYSVKITNGLIMQFSPFFWYIIFGGFKYSAKHFVFWHPQSR